MMYHFSRQQKKNGSHSEFRIITHILWVCGFQKTDLAGFRLSHANWEAKKGKFDHTKCKGNKKSPWQICQGSDCRKPQAQRRERKDTSWNGRIELISFTLLRSDEFQKKTATEYHPWAKLTSSFQGRNHLLAVSVVEEGQLVNITQTTHYSRPRHWKMDAVCQLTEINDSAQFTAVDYFEGTEVDGKSEVVNEMTWLFRFPHSGNSTVGSRWLLALENADTREFASSSLPSTADN